jgi:hypothetical protein
MSETGTSTVSIEIKEIFDKQRLADLKTMLSRRRCLNTTNNVLVYLYHLVQSAGILTSSVAAGYNNQMLIWVGISLNIFASLIHVYEKTNNSIMRKLMNDIKSIKEGNYIAEGELIDIDKQDNVDLQSQYLKARVADPTFHSHFDQPNPAYRGEISPPISLLKRNVLNSMGKPKTDETKT